MDQQMKNVSSVPPQQHQQQPKKKSHHPGNETIPNSILSIL